MNQSLVLMERGPLYEAAARILQHPIGNRATDEQLALAVLRGHTGRRQRTLAPTYEVSLTQGLPHAVRIRRTREGIMPGTVVRRRWRLYRSWQRDQGNTPQCVAYTKKHWELSLPIASHHGWTEAQDYARAKELDGAPLEDGTDALAMLEVAKEQGLVESSWYYAGSQDLPAARRWVLDVGPLWFGAYWTEEMFRTDDRGRVTVGVDFRYGHEVLVIGYDQVADLWEIVQSWGNDRYGIEGRAFIPGDGFQRLLANGGDLLGVIEKVA